MSKFLGGSSCTKDLLYVLCLGNKGVGYSNTSKALAVDDEGLFRIIMHFQAARRPFVSWGDPSGTHVQLLCRPFYFEKSWLDDGRYVVVAQT